MASLWTAAQWSTARSAKRHHFKSTVHESLVIQLLEYPPDRLHKGRVHGLVIIIHVNPSANPPDDTLPLRGVSHNDTTALGIEGFYSHGKDIIAAFEVELLSSSEEKGQRSDTGEQNWKGRQHPKARYGAGKVVPKLRQHKNQQSDRTQHPKAR